MRSNAVEIDALVDRQLANIAQIELVALIRSLRVPPRVENRPWDYGSHGETLPCWIVLEHQSSNTAVTYCSEGFGPTAPWGLLWLRGRLNMGMDSSWFVSLEDAVRDSRAWSGSNPPSLAVS